MKISITQDLDLRLMQEEDAETYFNLVDKNREYLKKWLPWIDSVKSVEDIKKHIIECTKSFEDKTGIEFAIFYKNKLVGSVSTNRIDRFHKKTDIGYCLDEEYTGKGIMTSSVKALTNYLFKELDINRIEIKVIPENIKSWAIPERLGFTFEGILRQDKFLNGKFFDSKIYSLLRSDKR
jgi:ribosomal-protein-serine acetyltransferase